MNSTEKRKNKVTIKDVAKAAEVSIATVSYVLNNTPGKSISDDTRKKVLQFANMLGYECNVTARYLATGKTNTVSALVKDFTPLASQYYLHMLTELSRLLWRHDFGLKIVDYKDGLKRNTDCDAYITLALSEKEFRAFADTKLIPVIAVDSVLEDFLFYRVNDDYSSLYNSAKTKFGADKVTLLTYELPPEVLAIATATFDDVITIKNANDIVGADLSKYYATVSPAVKLSAPPSAAVELASSSIKLKAAATVDAVMQAIDRISVSADRHNIKV